ncbi:Calcium uptake protein, mitochondrial [Zea mays]|uniref:Calcium uptake protein, mitochondrial n=1 Tax=Zea mays TaxID=4577 RepID=A0A3L6GA88_MAIZE|nr:Calcium uptake protein, mitochondrial [Zea mays]
MSVPHDRHQDLKLAIDDFDEELIDPELCFSFQLNSKVCGVDLTDKVVDIIFHVFDANCDGNLSSEEFLRKCLFSMMSDLPSVLEAFVDRKHGKDREENMAMPRVPGQHVPPAAKEYDEDEEEHTETFCGSCGDLYIGSN